ncbi:haloacid dehalogenase [Caloranaerobacter azorensis H53214]|uniref:Haloacid dehalogenase n=1 Tax=Caloranaerobacter azorensis H53214 TaxID=1156417 RepID=A0A096BIZ1_9FIRM|nr:HAD family hydrolase [Caloranaerobacter azorensis]KGG80723.1 haloacid dehalogenase [Caloranaerobacter azorensis H53214]
MIEIDIPSYKQLKIKYVVFDYNGTLAVDGIISSATKQRLEKLSKKVKIYILTADTYGNVRENIKDVNVNFKIISQENGKIDKLNFIRELGAEHCIAVGNGNNDVLMLKEAQIGICIIGDEGCFTETIKNSDIIIKNINDCLDLLLNPNRLKATLRG